MSSRDDVLTRAYLKWRTPLFRLLRRRLHNEADAEDITQESYARWAASPAATQPDDPQAYVTRIALNAVQEPAFRRERRADLSVALDTAEAEGLTLATDAQDCPMHQAEHRQALQRMLQAIEELPPRQREAFTRHRFDGLSYDQIAEEMQISRSMVNKHIAHALAYCQLRVQYPSAEAMLRESFRS